MKSTDGGVAWSDISDDVLDVDNLPVLDPTEVWDNPDAADFTFFSNVAIAPDNPGMVAVAGWGYNTDDDVYVPIVVGTDNGGSDWEYMNTAETLAGHYIVSLDVSMDTGGSHYVAVGTLDMAGLASPGAGSDAAMWLFDAGKFSSSWVNTSVVSGANWDGWAPSYIITDVKFSPNFDIYDTIVALTINWIGEAGDEYMAYHMHDAADGPMPTAF